MIFPRKAAAVAVAAFAAATLLAACGGAGSPAAHPSASKSASVDLSRIAANGNPVDGVLISLGLIPAYSDYPPSNWPSAEQPYVKSIKSLGTGAQTTCSFNLEALAGARPSLIIGTQFASFPPSSCLKTERGIAPVVLLNEKNYPPVDKSTGKAGSTWKAWTMSLASQIGKTKEAEEAFQNVDRRAAAIRGQVAGQTIAYIQLDSPSTWSTANQYFSEEQPFVQDLGMVPFDPSVVDKTCTNDPATPAFCTTQLVSDEKLPVLASADVILAGAAVRGTAFTKAQLSSLIGSSLWTSLPAVKDGHVNIGNDLSAGSPLVTSNLYSAIEPMEGIDEFHAAFSAAAASLTLRPSDRRLCWAVDPAGQQRPSGPLTLTAGGAALTLAARPGYAMSDTGYQTAGCATPSAASAGSLLRSPSAARLSLGPAAGTLTRGVPSVVAGS